MAVGMSTMTAAIYVHHAVGLSSHQAFFAHQIEATTAIRAMTEIIPPDGTKTSITTSAKPTSNSKIARVEKSISERLLKEGIRADRLPLRTTQVYTHSGGWQ